MRNALIVVKNITALLLRELVNKGSLIIMILFVARFLGKDALGRYTLALTISQVLFLATDLGLSAFLIREVAKDRSKAFKYLFNFGIVNLILSMATFLLVGLVCWVLRCPPELTVTVYLCALGYFFIRLVVLFETVFRAFERMEYQFFASLLRNLIFLSCGIRYLYAGGSLQGLFLIFIATGVVTLAAVSFVALRMVAVSAVKFDPSFIKIYTVKTLPIWLSQILAIVYLKMGTFILFRLQGATSVGVYNAAFIVVDGFLIISGILAAAFFPLFSRLHAHSIKRLMTAYERGLSFAAFLSLPIATVIILFADRLIGLFYGGGFEQAVPVMRILACTAALAIFGGLNSYAFITLDKQRILPYITTCGFLLNLTLNILLIPLYNYVGAALASAVTETVMFFTAVFIIKVFLLPVSLLRVFLKAGIATAIAAGFVYSLRAYNAAFVVAAGAALYCTVNYFLRGFLHQERACAKALVRNLVLRGKQ